ncbi:MAG: sporulation transcriptional regulator SpoIIID [Acholeplasmataceae bacterium]|nr:sporulation transcriptional regulator SpoIIID [Acholeplasmataceae bacterium]HOA63512.1 sporulation transcriptional regulator SpoIIID [Bacilli bacterium]HPT88932.1 sporulation transcriptional regulator SpoIIID [Bacilli bacterium]HQA19512.1 sporulation transcriptional regulator SpoIIID [Bacilli bacterium]HQD91823.1 sporulation transcriptional regulator SpoIIID [Bacilli bacterium]
MNLEIKQRVLEIADIFLSERSTVREVAKRVGCSKSTVHKDLTERLPEINRQLFEKVKELLEYNKSIRHIRGGESTKLRYLQLKSNN